MSYDYQYDDNIYDIESKPDVFTDAQYYPAQHKLIVSLIQDHPLLRLNQDQSFNQDDQQIIIDRIKQVNPALKNTHIVIENLKRVPTPNEWQIHLNYLRAVKQALQNHQDWQTIEKPNNADDSLIGFAYRMGIGNQDANGNHNRRPKGEAEHNNHNNFRNANHQIINPNYQSGSNNPAQQSPYISFNEYNQLIEQHATKELLGDHVDINNAEIAQQSILSMSKVFAQYYPLKDTDVEYTQFKQSPNPLVPTGLHLGYNSTNYDITMLASILSCIDPIVFNSVYTKLNQKAVQDSVQKILQYPGQMSNNDGISSMTRYCGVPTAKYIRESLNDNLFQNYLNNMWNFIPFNSNAYDIKKAWLSTNRYLDVSKFNEHQRKVSLKRISGMMGLQIKESDKLGDDKDEVKTLDNLAELLAYNVSDVYNTKLLFEAPEYQDGFQLKQSLLSTYPYTVYQQAQDAGNIQNEADVKNHQASPIYGRKPNISPTTIRTDRLHSDDSSAKFIANVISPFEKLLDQPTIDLHYPAQTVLNEIKAQQKAGNAYTDRTVRDKPYDVLDDTKDWVYGTGYYTNEGPHLGPNGQKEFEKIYQFYDAIRNHNVNDDLSSKSPKHRDLIKAWVQQHPERKDDFIDSSGEVKAIQDVDIKAIMKKYNTNVFYMNGQDQQTNSIANLSIGGIHGAELDLTTYRQVLNEKAKWDHHLEYIKTHYDSMETAYKSKDDLTFDDEPEPIAIRKFFKSSSTGKHAELKPFKYKELFKIEPNSGIAKVRKEYTYVSVGKASHEDFSSYYPTLLTMLAVFRDPDDGSDVYADVYHERLALKAKLKTLEFGTPEYKQINLEQNLRKLLLNSASGAGDATFESNIKMNNATVSMRIIGQLFAWRIGQAEANHGARVPSTNTDGLYVMDIDPAINDKVLYHTVDPMLINISPEIVDRFVSKDSNNRIEVAKNKKGIEEIGEAKGGTLTSWEGPSPANNLNHPAICDKVLAEYLAFKPSGHNPDSPSDQPFDRQYAESIFKDILTRGGSYESDMVNKMKLLQWVLASGISKHRHNFQADYQTAVMPEDKAAIKKNSEATKLKNERSAIQLRAWDKPIYQYYNDTPNQSAALYGEPKHVDNCIGSLLPRTNRIFMIKRPTTVGKAYHTIQLVNPQKVSTSALNTRRKNKQKAIEAMGQTWNPMNYTEADALTDHEYEDIKVINMMKQYVSQDTIDAFHTANKNIVCSKVTDMPYRQPIRIHNQALKYVTVEEYYELLHQLDIDAYLDIIENKFNKSWKNNQN